jgi:Xaa-Pro dipeptidase
MKYISDANRSRLIDYMNRNGMDAIFLYDNEKHRDSNLIYITGHPTDASAFVLANGSTALFPWDMILASRLADPGVQVVDTLSSFGGNETKAFHSFFEAAGLDSSGPLMIEIDPMCAVGKADYLKKIFPNATFKVSGAGGYCSVLNDFRAVKSEEEIMLLRNVAGITNSVIHKMEDYIREVGSSIREVDLALFVEGEGRRLGADGISFETLTANADRSWGIHCYPATTNSMLWKTGLALIDFGFRKDGYCSDVTVPMVFGKVSDYQEKIVSTVFSVYDQCLSMIRPGVKGSAVHGRAIQVMKEAGLPVMPHGLGHGIGLDCHDPMGLREGPRDEAAKGSWKDYVLEQGFFTSLEPGIYDPMAGGCRYENDVLVTENGVEVLTASKLLRFGENDD